jgi:ketosteroid isomerase-like protein
MSAESNVDLVRHIMEDGFNKKDLGVIDASFHENYIRHGYGVSGAGSLAEHRAGLVAQHEAVDDAKFTIERILADDNTVAVYFVLTGQPKSRPGTKLARHLAAFFTIVDGKVSEGVVISASEGV